MGKKVLLADDSATIQKLVEMALSDSGFELLAVSDGKRAVDLLDDFKPDIILADAIMPLLDGYQVCRHVKDKAEFRKVPVILLTGRFQPFDEARAQEAGIDLSLEKPFSQEVLVSTLNRMLSAGRTDDESHEVQEEDTLDLDMADEHAIPTGVEMEENDDNATVHMSQEDLAAHLEEVRARASGTSSQLPDFEDFDDTQPALGEEEEPDDEPVELDDFGSESDTIMFSMDEEEPEDEALELAPEDLEEIEDNREDEEMVDGAFDTLPGAVESKELIGDPEPDEDDRSWSGDEVNFERVTEEMAEEGEGIEEALGFETVAFTELGDDQTVGAMEAPEEIDESDLASFEDDDEPGPTGAEDRNRTLPSPDFEMDEDVEDSDNISLDTYSTFEDEVLEDEPLEVGSADTGTAEPLLSIDDSVDELADVELEEVEEVEEDEEPDSSEEYQLDWAEEDEEPVETTATDDSFSTIESGGSQEEEEEEDQDFIATEDLDDPEEPEPDLSEEDFRLELGEELEAGLDVEEPPEDAMDDPEEAPETAESPGPDLLDTEPVEDSAPTAEDVDTEPLDLEPADAESMDLIEEDDEPLVLGDETEEPAAEVAREREVFSDDLPEPLELAEFEPVEEDRNQVPVAEAPPEEPTAPEPSGEEGVSMAAIGRLSERELDLLAEKVVARLVHKLGGGAVRDVVWQVVPELAEAMIKKRIYQLEQGVDQE